MAGSPYMLGSQGLAKGNRLADYFFGSNLSEQQAG
jgi:hypothetical protein